MKIGVDTYPLYSGHKNRGIGTYTDSVYKALKKLDIQNEYTELNSHSKSKDEYDAVFIPYFELFKRSLHINHRNTIVTVHDVIPLKFPQLFPLGIRTKWILHRQLKNLRSVKYIITDSLASKEDSMSLLHIPKEKISVVYPSVSDEFLAPNYNTNTKFHKNYNYLLYVGDINPNKNLPYLLSVFTKIKKKYSDLHLILIGEAFLSESKEAKQIYHLIKNLGIEQSVDRLGFISTNELIHWYKNALAYVQPSLYEGFGLPVLEALYSGVPVVSSNAGSLPEVGGEAVCYFNPGNETSAIQAISSILEISKQERDSIIETGLIQAKKFTWGNAVKKIAELINNIG
jgi:glycosyltransferase involved in cell wall biosynthesis